MAKLMHARAGRPPSGWAGTPSDWLLFKNRVAGARTLPGAVYEAVASLDEPFLALACLKVAITCDKSYAQNRHCEWIGPTEITALGRDDGKGRKAARLCESILREAREKLPSANVTQGADENNQLNAVVCCWGGERGGVAGWGASGGATVAPGRAEGGAGEAGTRVGWKTGRWYHGWIAPSGRLCSKRPPLPSSTSRFACSLLPSISPRS